jgi:hypothetical protein
LAQTNGAGFGQGDWGELTGLGYGKTRDTMSFSA